LDNNEADRLLEALHLQQTTRLIVTGCDGTPMPSHIQSSLASKDIEVIGLSWLDHRGYHPEDLAMSDTYREHTLMESSMMQQMSSDIDSILDPGWGRYIPRGVIALPVSHDERP